MKRRKFFGFLGRAVGAVVGLAAGIGAVRSRDLSVERNVAWVDFDKYAILIGEVGTIEGVRWVESDSLLGLGDTWPK
jgi:hypothetical protein